MRVYPDWKTADARQQIKTIRERREVFTVVATNGVFDLFHFGHLSALRHAGAISLDGRPPLLVVAVNSDLSARVLKSSPRPYIPFTCRLELVGAVRYVDYAFGFDELTPEEFYYELMPDVLVKGEEYASKLVRGRENSSSVQFSPMVGEHTSDIVRRIQADKPNTGISEA
jgi:cytidyltransferase-like protein